jgi:hypothetical protein
VFKQPENKESKIEISKSTSAADSENCISSEVLFRNESIESVFGLKFENSASNSNKNKSLLEERMLKPTELLATDSITTDQRE